MATARLTYTSVISPSEKLGDLKKAIKIAEDIIDSSEGRVEKLGSYLETVASQKRAICHKGFQKLYIALNLLNSIKTKKAELDANDTSFNEEFRTTRVEAGQVLVDAISEFEKSISKIQYSMQMQIGKSVSKQVNVSPDLDENDEISSVILTSLDELKEAFDKVEIFRQKKEESRKKQNSHTPVEDEGVSVKTLEILKKYKGFAEKAPSNTSGVKKRGVFTSPVIISGQFKVPTHTDTNFVSLGSGFYLIENIPSAYIETGLSAEERTIAIKQITDNYSEKRSHRFVSMNDSAFRDKNSKNLMFVLLLPENLFRAMSPVKKIDSAAFPWANYTEPTVTESPKEQRLRLDNFIKNDKRMLDLIASGNQAVVRVKNISEFIGRSNLALSKEQADLHSLIPALEDRDGEKRRKAREQHDKLSTKIEKISAEIAKAYAAKKEASQFIKGLKDKKKELTGELREEFLKIIRKDMSKRK